LIQCPRVSGRVLRVHSPEDRRGSRLLHTFPWLLDLTDQQHLHVDTPTMQQAFMHDHPGDMLDGGTLRGLVDFKQQLVRRLQPRPQPLPFRPPTLTLFAPTLAGGYDVGHGRHGLEPHGDAQSLRCAHVPLTCNIIVSPPSAVCVAVRAVQGAAHVHSCRLPAHRPRAPPALVRTPTLIFAARSKHLFSEQQLTMASSSTGTLSEEGPWEWLPEELVRKVLYGVWWTRRDSGAVRERCSLQRLVCHLGAHGEVERGEQSRAAYLDRRPSTPPGYDGHE
jgi:hypothetical protein